MSAPLLNGGSFLEIPEFWRYDGQTWHIYKLVAGVYREQPSSPTFPTLEKETLYTFLAEAFEDEMAAGRSLHPRIQTLA